MFGTVKAPVENEAVSELAAAEFVDALRDVHRAVLSYVAKQAHASKLGLIEYLILVRACDQDGVTARDAARAFDLSTSTMTGISDRLERDKLVRRHPHPTDRRVLVLKATRRGQGVVARTTGPLLAELDELASALDAGQLTLLTGLLREITERALQPDP